MVYLPVLKQKGLSDLMTTIVWIVIAVLFILVASLFINGQFDQIGATIVRAFPILGG